MGKRKPPPDFLSEEDRAAWEQTAGTVEPLPRRHRPWKRAPIDTDAPPSADALKPRDRTPSKAPRPAAAPARRDEPPPFAEIGRRETRKLGAGRITIDARVDLHGMTQAQAHGALRRFLFAAYEERARWVLVITGKGARKGSGDDAGFDYAPRETGVLRRNVPLWLREPDLHAIVVGFRAATQGHGGDGALYIQVRQRRAG